MKREILPIAHHSLQTGIDGEILTKIQKLSNFGTRCGIGL